jgi:drug/metabolite transporter (DMT)-like permease
VAVGFASVLLIVQPKAQGFNWFAVVALAGTALHALRDLLTRRIVAGIPSLLITLSTALAVTIMGVGFAALEPWRPVEWRAAAMLAAMSMLLAAGYYLMVACVRLGELSVVAPFRYTALLWALVLGYVLWGDLPDAIATMGIVLLIGSGLYVLHRERIKRVTIGAD